MTGEKKYRIKLFDPQSKSPFALSRSKIDLFINCPRCFYLDRRLGISRPQFPAFTLNNAVDHLLKKEFDIHRKRGHSHPLMKAYGIDMIPFTHKNLEKWRHNFTGVRNIHEPSGFEVFGAVDDIWINPRGLLHVVDYKATSKNQKPDLDGYWQQAYKRQMEVYQWLLRNNGFDVSPTGYFVYVNGRRDKEAFDGKLEFDVDIISYTGNDNWIEDTLLKARKVLEGNTVPEIGSSCEYCPYRESAGKSIKKLYSEKEITKQKNKDTLF